MGEKKKKLLDIVREKIRLKHYSYSTERTYVHWIKHYIKSRSMHYHTEAWQRERVKCSLLPKTYSLSTPIFVAVKKRYPLPVTVTR